MGMIHILNSPRNTSLVSTATRQTPAPWLPGSLAPRPAGSRYHAWETMTCKSRCVRIGSPAPGPRTAAVPLLPSAVIRGGHGLALWRRPVQALPHSHCGYTCIWQPVGRQGCGNDACRGLRTVAMAIVPKPAALRSTAAGSARIELRKFSRHAALPEMRAPPPPATQHSKWRHRTASARNAARCDIRHKQKRRLSPASL